MISTNRNIQQEWYLLLLYIQARSGACVHTTGVSTRGVYNTTTGIYYWCIYMVPVNTTNGYTTMAIGIYTSCVLHTLPVSTITIYTTSLYTPGLYTSRVATSIICSIPVVYMPVVYTAGLLHTLPVSTISVYTMIVYYQYILQNHWDTSTYTTCIICHIQVVYTLVGYIGSIPTGCVSVATVWLGFICSFCAAFVSSMLISLWILIWSVHGM